MCRILAWHALWLFVWRVACDVQAGETHRKDTNCWYAGSPTLRSISICMQPNQRHRYINMRMPCLHTRALAYSLSSRPFHTAAAPYALFHAYSNRHAHATPSREADLTHTWKTTSQGSCTRCFASSSG